MWRNTVTINNVLKKITKKNSQLVKKSTNIILKNKEIK